MKVIGICGQIGSGKSTAAKLLSKKGAVLIDVDKLGHRLLAENEIVKNELIDHFGKDILTEDGKISRPQLGKKAFKSKKELEILNSITHPRLVKMVKQEIENNKERIVIIDAAVLIESGLIDLVDIVIGVRSTPENRLKRLLNNRNISKEDAIKRISHQRQEQEWLPYTDHIIENNSSLDNLAVQVEKVWEEIETLKDRES